jgi:hypothetical protein
MKRSLVLTCLIAICSLLILSSSAGAISLYAPDIEGIQIGSDFSYNIMIKDLEENQNLSEFDFTVIFDPSILKFNSYAFSDSLGSGDDVLDWSSGDIGNGRIHLAELSWLQNFEQPTKQPDSFYLVTLNFHAINVGLTPVLFEAVTLGDEWGRPLLATLENGSVDVVTPEPATVFLLGFGLIGVAGLRRKFKK